MIYSDKVKLDFEFSDPCLCNAWVATAIVGSAVVGAVGTSMAASKAANAQTNAANQAAATSLGMYNQTRSDLSRYRDVGQFASNRMVERLDELTTPITMTEDQVKQTPGYQFNLTQGLKATQNSAAARGLGSSGAALKGAATFATGLADSTYQNQFNNAVTNQTNAYNKLKGLVDLGENAAAQTGTAGTSAANTAAGAQIGAGNAQAAAANATGGAISSAANSIGGYAAYKGLYGGSNNNNSGFTVTDA